MVESVFSFFSWPKACFLSFFLCRKRVFFLFVLNLTLFLGQKRVFFRFSFKSFFSPLIRHTRSLELHLLVFFNLVFALFTSIIIRQGIVHDSQIFPHQSGLFRCWSISINDLLTHSFTKFLPRSYRVFFLKMLWLFCKFCCSAGVWPAIVYPHWRRW